MPEYLSPGVYVEEIPSGPVPIQGVSTSTAGFVGLTERGPVQPRLVTGWGDYVSWFGGLVDPTESFLPWAVKGFFDNGGQRVFVARVIRNDATTGVLDHPTEHGGVWAWPIHLATLWFLLFRVERRERHPTLGWGHTAGAVLFAAVLEWEVAWRLVEQGGWVQGWRVAAFALVPVVLLQLVIRLNVWPLNPWRTAYGQIFGSVLATGISLWAILSVSSPGGSDPFPWVPLLNPLDTMLAPISHLGVEKRPSSLA